MHEQIEYASLDFGSEKNTLKIFVAVKIASSEREVNANVEVWKYGRNSRRIPACRYLTPISEIELHRLV